MKHLHKIVSPLVQAALLIVPFALCANPAIAEQTQGGYAQTSLVSRIQVSGSADKMSLDVERGDVVSVLKAVMKQGQKMFIPDATVTGQVTLSVSDQSISNVLKAICEQSFLKYQIKDNIYKFTRDEDSIKSSFSRLKELNVQLRQQLRTLGLELPEDSVLDSPERAGGFGGGSNNGVGDKTLNVRTKDLAGADPSNRSRKMTPDAVKNARDSIRSKSSDEDQKSKGEQIQNSPALSNTNEIHTLTNGVDGPSSASLERTNNYLNGLSYQDFLQRNRLVYFNIPAEKPEPVSSVLQSIGRQANVPVFIDQSIPNSLKFRLWGNMSPRQLNDALNTIAPRARLQWRWVGNTVYVVPAPDFQIAFGDNVNSYQRNTIQGNYVILPPSASSPSKKQSPASGTNRNTDSNGKRP